MSESNKEKLKKKLMEKEKDLKQQQQQQKCIEQCCICLEPSIIANGDPYFGPMLAHSLSGWWCCEKCRGYIHNDCIDSLVCSTGKAQCPLCREVFSHPASNKINNHVNNFPSGFFNAYVPFSNMPMRVYNTQVNFFSIVDGISSLSYDL
jgi:hypothetical protein